MNESLTERGIVCFVAIDQPLVTELCEIIGALVRHIELSCPHSADVGRDIEKAVEESV